VSLLRWLASRRSGSLGRYFWRLMTVKFQVWIVANLLATYADLHPGSGLEALTDILFVSSTVSLGMALFLDPDHEPNWSAPFSSADPIASRHLRISRLVTKWHWSSASLR
jgi:hypothetical protein